MAQFIPYNFSLASPIDYSAVTRDVDLEESKDLITKIYNNEITLPTQISELTDGEVTQYYKLSVDAAAALKIPFGATEGKFTRDICIQQYEKYKIITDGYQKVKVGIGIRWTANVKRKSIGAKVDSLMGIAASAEFGLVDATIRFEQMGMHSPEITELIPAIASLNIDSYTQLNAAFEGIKDLVYNEQTEIRPVIISVLGDIKQSKDQRIYEESLARIWGLKSIKRKWSLREALERLDGESELFQDTLNNVYADITGITDPNEIPIPEKAALAKRLLNGFRIID